MFYVNSKVYFCSLYCLGPLRRPFADHQNSKDEMDRRSIVRMILAVGPFICERPACRSVEATQR